MTVLVFAVGILVFLITVYGTVVVGGLLLTERQIEQEPELAPETAAEMDDAPTATGRVRSVIPADF